MGKSRRWLPGALLVGGLVVGLIAGLASPWQLRLVQRAGSETVGLSADVRDEYMRWVAGSYAADGDLAKARERLEVLGEEDAVVAVRDLATRYMERGEEMETTRELITLAQALGVADDSLGEYMVASAPTATSTNTPAPTATPTSTATSTAVPTATSTTPPAPGTETPSPTSPPAPAPREWDPRLNNFYPVLRMEEAQVSPGQWYWRLIRTVWQDEWEAGGRHHIYVEVLDERGNRSFGQTAVVEYGGGTHPFPYPDMEKLGEEYAFNFIMHDVLGGYNVYVDGPDPSDKVLGLGLGTIQNRQMNYHTSFLLTFQRSYQS